jgi:hypothetical protein
VVKVKFLTAVGGESSEVAVNWKTEEEMEG